MTLLDGIRAGFEFLTSFEQKVYRRSIHPSHDYVWEGVMMVLSSTYSLESVVTFPEDRS
jgi:hypothetical protein